MPLVRRAPFVAFYVTAWLIALAVMGAYYVIGLVWDPSVFALLDDMARWIATGHSYTNIVAIARYAVHSGRPATWLIFVYAAAPSIAALVVTLRVAGREGVRALLTRYRPWNGGVTAAQAAPWYLALLAGHLALTGAYLWVAYAFAPREAFAEAWQTAGGSVPAAIGISVLGLFVDEGGTLEELGWRGFGLPRLLDRLKSPLGASVALGLLWAAWHMPELIPYALGHPTGAWMTTIARFFVMCAADTVIMTFFYFRTGGSVLPAIMIHASWNFRSKAFGAAVTQVLGTEPRFWIVVGVAAVIVVLTGPRLGQPRGVARGEDL